jgi:hypothetical protein
MSLRKDVEANKKFSIVIQTYNHIVKELEVFPEMTIGELKLLIEKNFMVKKEYQELLYLVYKLNNDDKQLKDYYIRPKGIIFLRGFYFPVLFVDYYEKKNKNVLSINIAEQIQYIRDEIINRLNLEKDIKYQLIFNGKFLDYENYLIDYNIQKMQAIYFK